MIKWFKSVERYIKLIVKRYNSRDKEVELYRERYKYSKFVIIVTIICIVCAIAIYFTLSNTSTGTYLSGWFALSAAALMVLVAISSPFSIVITNKNIILHGYADLYQIPLKKIESVRVVKKAHYKYYIPVFISFGYFGYFGFLFNWKKRNICRIYATKYSSWVEINTYENDIYVVNVNDPEIFIEEYNKVKDSI